MNMESTMGLWYDVGAVEDVPLRGSRVLRMFGSEIAVFRSGSNRVFALHDSCPHKGGKLSQGIVHGDRVTCPLHNWVIELASGEAASPDEGCARKIATRVTQGRIFILPNP
jgi:nitrite reductase (NADH) small subunit